jgi:hypothetical protein
MDCGVPESVAEASPGTEGSGNWTVSAVRFGSQHVPDRLAIRGYAILQTL